MLVSGEAYGDAIVTPNVFDKKITRSNLNINWK
jgi:hypothetical protein